MADLQFLVPPKAPALSADPSSPSAGDIYFNTSTNKLRVYNGSTWDEWSSGGPTYYPTTVSSASNTTSETTVMSFSITANTMDDGDIIRVLMSNTIQQNSGGAINLTLKFGWTGVGGTKWIAINNGSVASGATTGSYLIDIYLQRIGSNLRLRGRSGSSAAELTTGALGNTPPSVTNNDAATSLNSPSFAADIPMVCTATWGTASAAAIYQCLNAKAIKF